MRAGGLSGGGLACLLFAGLASGQSPFQLTLNQQGNSVVIQNGSTLSFSSAVGQTETAQITAVYRGFGSVVVSQPPQIAGSSAFTASTSARPPLTLTNGGNLSFEIQFRASGTAQSNAQLTIPYVETLTGPPPTFAPTTSNGTISLGLLGSSPSIVLSYIFQSDQNVIPVSPGGTIAFPSTPINTTTTATFNITNRGSGPGQINDISISGAAFRIVGQPLFPATIAANQTLQVGIRYTPTAIGEDTGQLQITIDSTPVNVQLRGTGISTTPLLSYQVLQGTNSSPVDPGGTISQFPDTNIGETNSVVVQVKNVGNGPATINSINLTGAGFQLSDTPALPLTLAVNASTTFTITFAPTRPGNISGRLAVGADTFNLLARSLGSNLTFWSASGDSKIPLSNNTAVFSPTAISTSTQLDLVVRNIGTLPARIANIGIGEANSPFSLSGLPALPVAINPDEEARFTVSYTPITTGFSSGTLRLDTAVISLLGSGTAPPALPSYTIQGPSGNVDAQSQPVVRLSLSRPYPVAVTGVLAISVSGDQGNDPAVQFSTGGRTVQFVIPANSTNAVFPGQAPQIRLQTGTVASGIVLTPTFSTQAGGLDLTPTSPAVLQFNVVPVAPVLIANRVSNSTAEGFTVIVTGYSTTRSLTTLDVKFTPAAGFNIPQTQFTVDLRQASTSWFQSFASQAFGGQFTVAVPFRIRGTAPTGQTLLQSLAALSVTVSNDRGTSNSLISDLIVQ